MSELAAALVEVQKDLPKVKASRTAEVKKKDGSYAYSYSYADLADITAKLLPVLNEHALAFTARPTLDDDGTFVLSYQLLHPSGETLDGRYPLPLNGSPQQQGSAITYARRYALCAVVGLVADDDDDAQAAETVDSPSQAGASDELMASVDEWIDKALEVGLEPDGDKLRVYAVTSDGHAQAVVKRLKHEVLQTEKLGDDDVPF